MASEGSSQLSTCLPSPAAPCLQYTARTRCVCGHVWPDSSSALTSGQRGPVGCRSARLMGRKRPREEATLQGESPGASHADQQAEEKQHKADLEALKLHDPEFYEYLQQTDKDLLDFGRSDSESDREEQASI